MENYLKHCSRRDRQSVTKNYTHKFHKQYASYVNFTFNAN